jgi:hypothetical protein
MLNHPSNALHHQPYQIKRGREYIQVNFAIKSTNSAIVVKKYMCVVYMLVIRALLLKPSKC